MSASKKKKKPGSFDWLVDPHSGRTISAEEVFISISQETCASRFIQCFFLWISFYSESFLSNVSSLSFPPMQEMTEGPLQPFLVSPFGKNGARCLFGGFLNGEKRRPGTDQ